MIGGALDAQHPQRRRSSRSSLLQNTIHRERGGRGVFYLRTPSTDGAEVEEVRAQSSTENAEVPEFSIDDVMHDTTHRESASRGGCSVIIEEDATPQTIIDA